MVYILIWYLEGLRFTYEKKYFLQDIINIILLIIIFLAASNIIDIDSFLLKVLILITLVNSAVMIYNTRKEKYRD